MDFKRNLLPLALLLYVLPIIALILISFRDNYLFPYLAVKKLNSPDYVQEIKAKQGHYENVENKVVWNSRKLDLLPPELMPEETKVLSASPGTWIEINLSTQTLCLHHSGVSCFAVSTGNPWTPTPTGTFYIWTKLASTTMAGPGYYLPGVPWTMYFYKGYGVHGTYWHNNFGHTMSHGCVNMRTPEAKFVYDRVSVGTKVFIHY